MMPALTLSPDQETALAAVLAKLKADKEAVLCGAAGTGKTTVMSAVIDAWSGGVQFFAPTGKAASRLKQSVGEADTIHAAFFGSVVEEQPDDDDDDAQQPSKREKLVFGAPHPPEGAGRSTLLVIDEASMVNDELAATVREQAELVGSSILWVGDHHQLPPVTGSWGADLQNPDGELTTVHRQAQDAPALALATAIREDRIETFGTWGGDCTIHRKTENGRAAPAHVMLGQAALWRARAGSTSPTGAVASDDRVLLTFTNKNRSAINTLVRRYQQRGQAPELGETLLCTFNARDIGLMNGETAEIVGVRRHDVLSNFMRSDVYAVELEGYSGEMIIAPEAFEPRQRMSPRRHYKSYWEPLLNPYHREHWQRALDNNLSDEEIEKLRTLVRGRGLQVTWGYCLTVHKSQGSQWAEVGFVSCGFYRSKATDDPEFWRRLGYTAFTRTEAVLRIFVV